VSRSQLSTPAVGNDFVLSQPVLQAATALPAPEQFVGLMSIPVETVDHQELIPVSIARQHGSPFTRALDLAHRHSLVAFALLFLLVASSGLQVGSRYWNAHIENSVKPITSVKVAAPTISGLNVTVPHDQLEQKLNNIASQPADLAIADQTAAISPEIIKSWLQVTPSSDHSQDYIRVKGDVMTKSVMDLASQFVKAPVNQVSLNENGTPYTILAGQNGTKLTDPDGLKGQVTAAAKTLMDSGGLHFSAPTESLAFATVGPEAFDKLIDANVTTKHMYLFEKGQLYKSYAVSAGKPSTPTPLGQFKIFSKLAVQDMRGHNPDGSEYFQPHVRWINYFLPGGYAVHGNYWRPLSWFGNINSSHGCVSLPDDQAKEVYDWAPVGTTVITHA